MDDCIFCKIAKGEIPARVVYEDEQIMAFHDLSPQAPVHVLIITKRHIPSVFALGVQNTATIGHLMTKVKEIAALFPEAKKSFRLVTNYGADAGQTVDHLHFHLLAGRKFKWPPG